MPFFRTFLPLIALSFLLSAPAGAAGPEGAEVSGALAAEAARPGIANADALAQAADDADAEAGMLPEAEAEAEEILEGEDPARATGIGAAVAEAPGSFDWDMIIQPIRTDSPRRTVRSIIQLRDEIETSLRAYREEKTTANLRRLELVIDRFLSLIDLSEVPPAARREVGITTMTHLLDVFGRVGLPPLEEIPGEDAFDAEGAAVWRIPETPLRIVRVEEGPRRYEFLISSRAVEAAPRFAESITELPLQATLPIRSWSETWPQITGSLIPASAVRAVPEALQELWLDTPIWKVLAVFGFTLGGAAALLFVNRVLKPLEKGESRVAILARFVTPLLALGMILFLDAFFEGQINLSGDFSSLTKLVASALFYIGLAWVFWSAANGVFGWIIASPKISNDGLNASLLRLAARLIGLVGAVIIVAIGASNLGLPVYSLIAGLGVGGLAVALAVRPTLENLIGGIVLFADKPVRLGDFCTFGGNMGTVESIGLRSTHIRALDRTLIAIPNAKFADMEITNWARCDRMLIYQTINLRYETTPDQLRYTLVKIREMFHAHPRIDPETVRVRFIGFGDAGFKVEFRVYAVTREWNDFFAITEDVLLRIYTIVDEAGSGIALPSQTLYMARDHGTDAERGKVSAERVRSWRRTGKLPFPRLSAARMAELQGTLDYPPRGSVETWAGGTPPEVAEMPAGEFLSAPPTEPEREKPEREKEEERAR